MDTRIGYPNEHLLGNSDEEFSSPLYATAGLVMNSIENKRKAVRKVELAPPKPAYIESQL
jgi:cell division protein FtsA